MHNAFCIRRTHNFYTWWTMPSIFTLYLSIFFSPLTYSHVLVQLFSPAWRFFPSLSISHSFYFHALLLDFPIVIFFFFQFVHCYSFLFWILEPSQFHMLIYILEFVQRIIYRFTFKSFLALVCLHLYTSIYIYVYIYFAPCTVCTTSTIRCILFRYLYFREDPSTRFKSI